MQGARRVIAQAWAIYAHMAGLALLSVGLGWGLVAIYASDEPVIIASGPVTNVTERVRAGSAVSYNIDMQRLQSCPGQWTATLTSITNHGPPAVVTISRPARPGVLAPGLYADIRVTVALPEAVTPGRWHYESGVTSRCPTRTRYDRLAVFDFEVTP
ncbi:hypothetical protein [Chelatococcus reniformis]|uniref:Uncharacterized protein n=1 Tax=Chelatococcus reniformis TaxID=1494448 RepID=A0A916UEV5_9HYPH|nr:hypothetical protein [Chelatococcus reniformis]GGC71011.1 hypothetical protein GCM10010994_31930 [Chelatococcus reniformis]